jgi:hypothetical protein
MLFDLANTIGLVADNTALAYSKKSDCSDNVSEVSSPIKTSASDNSMNSHSVSLISQNLGSNSANDEILPEHHYRADDLSFRNTPNSAIEFIKLKYSDSKWIKAKLRRLPAQRRQSVIEEYSNRYKLAFESEPEQIKKINRARFIANTWLLKVTKA